ncbi:MAG: CYTH domain-containing protein [Bacteroidales bacterium]|nr:CYTH domain-containing protein [Bacteroidales bacterium]
MKHMEIERKFLVDREKWASISKPPGINYIQGYLSIDEDKVVRVRVAGDKGFLTIKGKSDTFSHPEYEYPIPPDDARELIQHYSVSRVEKVRTRIGEGKHVWEVDEFRGENEGLLMAEIELENADDVFEKPVWLGEEVTDDKRYYNAWLSLHPFRTWQEKAPYL